MAFIFVVHENDLFAFRLGPKGCFVTKGINQAMVLHALSIPYLLCT